MLTEHEILEALRGCYDSGNPFGKPINLVDLGSVESLTLTPDPDAPGAGIPGVPPRLQLALTLLPTSADEDARAQLAAQVSNALAGLEQLSRTTLTFADTWTPTRIRPATRVRLKLDPPHFAILNNRR